jgi:serine phosphatase RsbU (regulator of sigma subunit)
MKPARQRNWKVAVLIAYGIGVLALIVVGLWRQAQMVRQTMRLGDPGVTLQPAPDGQGFQVTQVAPASPAGQLLQVGDRVLQIGDLSQVTPNAYFRLNEIWRYQGRPVAPGTVVPVLRERNGVRRQVFLRFEARPLLARRFAPGAPPLGLFLLGTLLPARLTLLGFVLTGWLVLLRRPASRDAHLFFLSFTTAALSFSYWYAPPAVYPMPLRWLAQNEQMVRAWIVAFALHFVLARRGEQFLMLPRRVAASSLTADGSAAVVPHPSTLNSQRTQRLVLAVYLAALAITGLALLATLRPAVRPSWFWVQQQFTPFFWLPAWFLIPGILLRTATRGPTPAGRRQARTLLLGTLPWIAVMAFNILHRGASRPIIGLIESATMLLVPVSFAYAILRQGLLDLGFVLRQGLVYGAVVAVGVAGYYLLILGAGRLLLSLSGQINPLTTMAATLLLAAMLRPVAVYSRRWVDRHFYRDRLETARRLRAMSQEMLSLLDRDAIILQLTSHLPAIFPARSAALFLCDARDGLFHRAEGDRGTPPLSLADSLLLRRQQQTGEPVSTYLHEGVSPATPLTAADREVAQQSGAVLWVPMLLRDRLIGSVALGWKVNEDIYSEEEREALRLIAGEAAVALENAGLSAEREQQARLQQEVAIGRTIQMSLLSPPRLTRNGYEILSRSEPAAEVGGDFYNLFAVGRQGEGASTRLGILVGDVAGKGVPAALFMAVTTTLIEAQAQLLPSPAETLAAANVELYPKMRRPGDTQPVFATAVYGVLDEARKEIRLASAGHPPPILWPADGPPRYLKVKGIPLGALSASRYEETVVPVKPGDRLLFCSDGFIEERTAEGEALGYDGFLRRLEALGDRGGPELIAALFDAADASGDEPFERDDRTLVLITAAPCASTSA